MLAFWRISSFSFLRFSTWSVKVWMRDLCCRISRSLSSRRAISAPWGRCPYPSVTSHISPTYRQGTRLGNLVLATKILTAMLKSSCTFLSEVKSKHTPVKQDKIDDTIPGWLYTLPKHRTYRQIFSTSAFCDKIPEFRFLSYKCYTFTFSEFIFRCPEVDTWWRHVVSEMGVDHRFSYFNEIKLNYKWKCI